MVKTWIKGHELITYFFLAYLFSWIFAVPLAFSVQSRMNNLPLWWHYFTAYGPMLSALVTTAIVGGIQESIRLFVRLFDFKIPWYWFLLAFSPFIIYIIINYFVKGIGPEPKLLGQINFLPNFGFLALVLWTLNSGLGEEVGWRGFALPRLQRDFSAIKASLILGVFWVGWHLPAFFYLPTYIKLGLGIFPMFALGVICGSVVYTWIFNSTKGSVLIAVLFHGVFNFVTASKAGEGLVAAVLSTLVIFWAVGVIILNKSDNFTQ